LQNQVWLYKKHVPPSGSFPDGQKRIMLQNAVTDIIELGQLKITSDQMVTTSSTMLTYDVLLSAGSPYHDQFKATKSNCHEMLYYFQHDEAGSDD
jgi:hypothetical protein